MKKYVLAFASLLLIPTTVLAANESNKTAAAIKDKYISKGCSESPFLKTNRLACVSCGIEKFTDGIKPSEKYLAMLGFATAKYSFLGSTITNNGKVRQFGHAAAGTEALELFQRNVIQKIQAYGFCVDGRVNKSGDLIEGSGYGKVPADMIALVSRALSGSSSTNSVPVVNGSSGVRKESNTGYSSADEKQLIKFFGFNSESDLSSLYNIEGWTYLSPQERQNAIREALAKVPASNPYSEASALDSNGIYASGKTGDALKECVRQMNDLVNQKDSVFNLKGPNSSNQELCQLMAIECDIDMEFCTKTPKTTPPTPSNSSGTETRKNLFEATKGKQ